MRGASRGVARWDERRGGRAMMQDFLDVAGTREILSSVGAAPACMVRNPCARAVSGLRPEVLWPPARSWLTVAALGESPRCGRKCGPAPRRGDGAPEGARTCPGKTGACP